MDTIKAHEEFQALFNNGAIGIIIANKQGDVVLANRFALKQFGYEEEELEGQKVELLIPRRYKEKHVGHRDNYNSHVKSRPMGTGMDLFGIKKDGTEFPVEVSLAAYKTKKADYVIAFISDISLRKQSERALLELNAELEQKVEERTKSLSEALAKEMELNELKSRFVSLASHEFRTPLSTIQSSAYLISQYVDTADQHKRDKHIQRIVSAVTTLTDILNDFLSVGRIEEGRIQVRYGEFDLKEFTHSILEELGTIKKSGQNFSYVHSGNKEIMLDSTLYKHIIVNLLSNAIKFSAEDAEISITTKIENGGATISVKDKGLGIPPEDLEHLFERFFRATNVSNIQGTGLGLHIVSKYAELMNGTISCNSELGEGTEFIIQFAPKEYYENNTIY